MPSVAILFTGGTISMRHDPVAGGNVPVLSGRDLLATVPGLDSIASLVPITHYRPAYALYPRISSEIQVAMESVMTGTADVPTAVKTYDERVKGIAGDAVMTAAGS